MTDGMSSGSADDEAEDGERIREVFASRATSRVAGMDGGGSRASPATEDELAEQIERSIQRLRR